MWKFFIVYKPNGKKTLFAQVDTQFTNEFQNHVVLQKLSLIKMM